MLKIDKKNQEFFFLSNFLFFKKKTRLGVFRLGLAGYRKQIYYFFCLSNEFHPFWIHTSAFLAQDHKVER